MSAVHSSNNVVSAVAAVEAEIASLNDRVAELVTIKAALESGISTQQLDEAVAEDPPPKKPSRGSRKVTNRKAAKSTKTVKADHSGSRREQIEAMLEAGDKKV